MSAAAATPVDLTAALPAARTLTAADLDGVVEELATYHAHFAPLFQRRQQSGDIGGQHRLPRHEPVVELDCDIADVGIAEGPRGTGQPMHQALELAQIAAVADLGDGLPVALQPGAERPVGIEQFQILLARPGRTHQ